ncbi:LysR family transcriptional regulator [Thiolinea disciformis]|uniref:LysR family transcriptional regulator n=1 Tax=Thiolinea disciformis TaxID=125614 RepID=UPI0003814075|nr:LysR family transcriptional regulator [Thiolinea disciformis]
MATHYYKQAPYKLLKTFSIVAQKENITYAAEALHISQPTVSLQVQALEREMGVALLERRGPSVRLTPEGKILYQLVQPLTSGIDNLRETFAASLGKMEMGELHIAAGQSTSLYILPDFIKRFKKSYPGIRIHLHTVEGQSGMKLLLEDQVDLAIGPLLQVPEHIIYRPFATFHSILIVPQNHPLTRHSTVTLQDISPYGLILPPKQQSTWRMVDTVFRQHNVPYKVSMEAGGWEIVKQYVEMGLGVSIVTDVCLTGKENIVAILMDAYFPSRQYGLIVRKGKFFTPQAKRFIEMFDPRFFDPD